MALPLTQIIEKAKAEGHSSDYLEDITQYAQKLASNNLPVIFSTTHLAHLIGISPYRLMIIIEQRKGLYQSYKLRKKNGGYRWINSPKKELKFIQGWIKSNILENISRHESALGFHKGTSIKKNAEPHQNKETILNIDLYRFFDSITEERVFGLFKWLGYHPNLSVDLAKLLCFEPPENYYTEAKKENVFSEEYLVRKKAILPQGSPASPIVSNLLVYTLDKRLLALSKKANVSYTRYADDLTFSGPRKDMVSLNTVKKIIHDEGFYINKHKTKFLTDNMAQKVTGIIVNKVSHIQSEYKKRIFTELYFLERHGVREHLEFVSNKTGLPIKSNYKDYLLGKIYFVNSIEPEVAKKMLEAFFQIKWEI